MKVLVVTDPLCSWCWGMAPAVEEALGRLGAAVTFDVLLGGINVHSTLPVGDYGRRLLLRIWREVAATTGQRFGYVIPDGMVFNSTRPCLAVAGLRRALGQPPLGYLHRLQQRLFVEGQDITDPETLTATATELGLSAEVVAAALDDTDLAAELAQEFSVSRSYGTNALPNVLIEDQGERRLLAGGYADAPMLESLIRARL